jgi:hypothetical protein
MRFYNILLYLYPSSFRGEYAEEMTRVFMERRRLASNRVHILWLWLTEGIDIIINALGAHSEIFRQDLHYTRRTLLRSPGFTLTAIIVTGLGLLQAAFFNGPYETFGVRIQIWGSRRPASQIRFPHPSTCSETRVCIADRDRESDTAFL